MQITFVHLIESIHKNVNCQLQLHFSQFFFKVVFQEEALMYYKLHVDVCEEHTRQKSGVSYSKRKFNYAKLKILTNFRIASFQCVANFLIVTLQTVTYFAFGLGI